MNDDTKTTLNDLYRNISDDILKQLKTSNLDPNHVADCTNISQQELLNLLTCQETDYLKYRAVNASIKSLTKSKTNSDARK